MTTTMAKPQRQQAKRKQPRHTNQKTRLPNLMLKFVLVTTLLGFGLMAYLLTNRAPIANPGQIVSTGDISIRVDSTTWLAHDGGHVHEDGEEELTPEEEQIEDLKAEAQVFPMPDSMMPGMPLEGQHRVQVEFTIHNKGDEPYTYRPEDFRLFAGDGQSWLPLTSGAFGAGNLGAGQSLNGTLAFDVEEEKTEAGLYLLWKGNGTQLRVPVPPPPEGHH